jgi:Domain of unknown function (DUF4190)
MTNPYSNDPTSGSGARPGDTPADPPIYLDPDTHQQLYMDPVTGEFRYDPASGAETPPGTGMPSAPAGQPPYPSTPYPTPPYPYAPPPPPYGYVPQRTRSSLATASMVTSLVGAATLFCWGLGGLVGLVGAILGHVARRKIRLSGEAGDGMALAGIIVGWIVFVLGVTGAVLLSLALANG